MRLSRLPAAVLLLLLTGGCRKEEEPAPRVEPGTERSPVSERPRGDTVGTVSDSGMAPPSEESLNPYADAGPTALRFLDGTAASGIDAVNHSGREGVKEYLLEAVGVGPAWLDYDGDGLLDLYVPDGDILPNYRLGFETDERSGRKVPRLLPQEKKERVYRDQLWRNLGDGRFEDVAEKVGIVEDRWSFGATAFDYDGDGFTDVFVANLGGNRLWRNDGKGRFTDVAPEVGLVGPPGHWCTAGAPGDFDGDGRLDLFVTAYSDPAAEVDRQRVTRGLPPDTPVDDISGRSCRWKGIRAYCGPVGLEAQHDVMYRQGEDGRFRDVTDEWEIRPREAKYGFTALAFDYDQDGLLDVYVANDSVESFLWHQERTKAPDGGAERVRFREVSASAGVKYGANLNPQAGMGLAAADVNQDGILDLFKTNFSHDYNNLYIGHRAPGGRRGFLFKDRGLTVMGQAVYFDLAWGCGWYDFDDDADLDLYVANGHVYKEIDLYEATKAEYDQHNALFECLEPTELKYREVGPKAHVPEGVDREDLDAGPGMAVKKCSRGAAFADANNDGFVEVFVQNMNDVGTLLWNACEPKPSRRWVKLLLSQPGGNREALGATVVVRSTAPGKDGKPEVVVQTFPVLRETSFLGSDDPRIHVGLGPATTCDVTVVWPDRTRPTTEFPGLSAGSLWVLDRETAKAREQPMPAFAHPR